MAKYRKKPVVIEAFQWRADRTQVYPQWLLDAYNEKVIISYFESGELVLAIITLEGTMIAKKGDYIIKGIKGEMYPCKPDIFEATYEIVEDDND